jgi:hypothetical protein
MKSIFKLIGIIALAAIIGVYFSACGDSGSGSGELTITGLNIHENKFVFAHTNDISTDGTYAAVSYNWNNMTGRGGEVIDGKVTLNIWNHFDVSSRRRGYSGSHSDIEFDIFIHESATQTYFGLGFIRDGTVTVSFSSGAGSGMFEPY